MASITETMFVSTDPDSALRASFEDTLWRPIPSKGHLWMPRALRPIAWPGAGSALHKFVECALAAITGINFDFSRCLLSVHIDVEENAAGLKILNLHRGPTKSFKDFGCQCAAQIYRSLGMTSKRTVVATSGDTGSAAAHAFQGLPITVLFPANRISPYQARQMAACTRATVMAVEGDFDACQAHVKRAIASEAAQSCNSISLARLLPQIGYYAWLAAHHPDLNVIVPSGNFGNACAAEMARVMGAPIARVHFACNQNDAVARLVNGHDEEYCPKTTVETPATAMDVGSPSNFVRIMHLCGNDVYELRRRFTARVARNENIMVALGFDFEGEKMCPHTAVAAIAAINLNLPKMCIVRTADACKFEKDDAEAMPYVPLCLNPQKAMGVRRHGIVLVGMPSVGKTTLSRILNGKDTDALICEDQGKPLAEIISERSVKEFLRLEAEVSRRAVLSLNESDVLATGGSVVYTPPFADCLDESLVVWLDANVEDLRRRLGDTWNSRGVVSPHGTKNLDDLYRERSCLYATVADVKIDTSAWPLERIVAFMRSLL